MKEQQQKEKKPVYQVVRPYIYEGPLLVCSIMFYFSFPVC